MLKLSGFDCSIKQDPKDKTSYVQYTPKQTLDTMFLFCDLFLQSSFLRKHVKEIKKDKLTFEYEGNVTLAKLNKKGMIDVFLKIAEQLLQAVYACHQHKIPGRCFNPDNIIWNEKNQHIVLMEFGLAPKLEINPPELLDPQQKCYGVEVDQFLIGYVLYQLWFGKPLIISSDKLQQQEKQLNQELEQIMGPTIKAILKGLLNFKFAKRMKLYELAKILRVDEKIYNFYSPQNVDFQRTCEVIDQKIFFREAGDSVFANPIFIQTQEFQSCNKKLNFDKSWTNSTRSSLSSIQFEKTVDFKKQLTDQITIFQCFDDTITIQREFNQNLDPIILISTLGFIKCKMYFLKKFKDDIQNQHSKYFISSDDESSLWSYFVKKESKFISKTQAEFEQQLNKTTISTTFAKEVDEITQIVGCIDKKDLLEYQKKFLVDLKKAVQNLNNDCSLDEFLLQYKNASLVMLILIDKNPEFTENLEKALLLKIQILLCCFADYFFIFEKNINYLQMIQELKGQPYKPQIYINKFSQLLKSLKESKFAQGFMDYLNILE